MKLLLQLFAMILLVLPAQHLIRGIIGGIQGKGYSFAILGLSNIVVIIGSIGSILISFVLFHKLKEH
ncbi:hypothetical protein [Enterococcus dongliensis]|uniref:hypothetical protein n=1 Tax=Enterococcus dongliensis TaxID=2559925 RepID=UPI00289033C2|nr:hypothetical protein [Enterococcus dongliensis]MDT2674151.1 hypothetical protein [Enterococcus dongliensis]